MIAFETWPSQGFEVLLLGFGYFFLDFGMALTRHPVGVYIQNYLTRGMFLDMGKRKIMFKLNFET